MRAHTLDLSHDQRIGQRVILTPRIRFYDQGAASFFAYEFGSARPFMSSDYRLSSFWSWLGGLGLSVKVSDHLSLNIGATYQDQIGLDRTCARMAPVVLKGLGPVHLSSDDDDDEDEEEGGGGSISPADLTTFTATAGFTLRF